MEAVMVVHSLQNQTISSNKSDIGKSMNIKRNNSFNSRTSENYLFRPNFQAGILQTPHPFLYHSYPPYSSQQNRPAVFPEMNGISRVINFSPINRKSNNCKTNDPSQIHRKSISSPNSQTKGGNMTKTTKKVAKISPDPKNLRKEDVPKMMVSSHIPSKGINFSKTSEKSLRSSIDNQVDKIYSSVIFSISPSPSSLPLPTFSLRPKVSCKAEAVGINAGATDDLRRLLRLP